MKMYPKAESHSRKGGKQAGGIDPTADVTKATKKPTKPQQPRVGYSRAN